MKYVHVVIRYNLRDQIGFDSFQDSGVQPKCIIYQHHFSGRSSTHIKNAPNLGNMNNDASSIRVESGA